jgi:hypothetical protein
VARSQGEQKDSESKRLRLQRHSEQGGGRQGRVRRSRTSISADPISCPTCSRPKKDVLTQVTEARAKATAIHLDANDLTDPEKVKALQAAQAQLSGTLGRLIAVSENYPELKSNQNFLALQSQLEGTENCIAVARRDYIAAVQDFNISLSTFPTLLWANTAFAGTKPMVPFTAEARRHRARRRSSSEPDVGAGGIADLAARAPGPLFCRRL